MQQQYDIIIIGAGPAGLAAAIYTARRGLSTVIFEEAIVGGRASYAHSIDNYPGFPEGISGSDLVSKFARQAEKFGAVIKGEAVVDMELFGEAKRVKTATGTYTCHSVIITTGLKQKKLNVPGEDKFLGRGVSYCATCDGFFFKNRKIVVLGGGNEAASDVVYLSSLTTKLRWIVNGEKMTADDVYLSKLKELGIQPEMENRVIEVFGEGRVEGIKVKNTGGIIKNEETDGLFIVIGVVPTVEILRKAGLNIDDMNYIMVNEEMETNIPGIYAAGDCTGKSHQVVVAVGHGALAGINASDYLKLRK